MVAAAQGKNQQMTRQLTPQQRQTRARLASYATAIIVDDSAPQWMIDAAAIVHRRCTALLQDGKVKRGKLKSSWNDMRQIEKQARFDGVVEHVAHNEPIEREELIGYIIGQYGIKRRTAYNYILQLAELGRIVVDGNTIRAV